MDKYEKKVRVNQIVSCIKNGEYYDAQEIADTIDWRQEKSIRNLRMVSEVYKINKRYEDSLAVLNLAYEKNPEDPIKRKIVYDLCELAIKMGQFGIAVRYMKEFSRLAPKDPGRYILQYRLLKATDADYGERIELLEEFKSRHFGDFDGRWAYELAYMYHLTGKGEKCVECCNEIALWFVTGPVVVKALKLKKEHQQLSYEEEQKILSSDQGMAGEEVLYQKKHDTDTAPVYMDTTPVIGDGYSTADAEERLNPAAQGSYLPNGYYPEGYGQEVNQPLQLSPGTEASPQDFNIEVKKVDASLEPTIRMAEKKTGPSIMTRDTNVLPDINKSQLEQEETTEPVPEPVKQPEPDKTYQTEPVHKVSEDTVPVEEMPVETPAIPGIEDAISQTGSIAQQEISVNLDKFSTMNLQAELRENMEKLQEETGEPLREKEEKLPDRVAEPDKELTEIKADPMVLEKTGDSKTGDKTSETASGAAPIREPLSSEPVRTMDPTLAPQMTDEEVAAKISRVPVPDQFRNYISQEMDGQMQLNVPADEPMDEKQITGQMDIESILAEWDKLQAEARERRIRAAKQKSLEQTNELARPLANVLPGYELPNPEDLAKEEIKEPEPPVEPMVSPKGITGGVDISEIESALEAEVEKAPKERLPKRDIPEKAEDIPEEPEPETDTDTDGYGDEPDTETKTETEPAERDEAAEDNESGPDPVKKNPHFVSYETVELPSVFDSFLNIKGLAPQLKAAEDRMSMEASHGNVLIVGSEHAARMELIQAIVRDMGEKEARGEIKAAAIDADTFNNKDVVKSVKALAGNVLVIEGAGRLSDDAMNALLSCLTEEGASSGKGESPDGRLDILVILEDSKGGAKNLNEYNGFDDVFNVLVDIPTLSNDYLVDHAKSYAMEKGYTLDDMAVLALYQRIDERQTADHVVTSDEVEHIIDAAIKKANKKNLKHLGDVLFGKRYNDEDLIVLREKDFAK